MNCGMRVVRMIYGRDNTYRQGIYFLLLHLEHDAVQMRSLLGRSISGLSDVVRIGSAYEDSRIIRGV